jgi:hypothetical protein
VAKARKAAAQQHGAVGAASLQVSENKEDEIVPMDSCTICPLSSETRPGRSGVQVTRQVTGGLPMSGLRLPEGPHPMRVVQENFLALAQWLLNLVVRGLGQGPARSD